MDWQKEPYYPVNDERNNRLYETYRTLANQETNVIFGGRLAEYRYLNMDEVVEMAMNMANYELKYIENDENKQV